MTTSLMTDTPPQLDASAPLEPLTTPASLMAGLHARIVVGCGPCEQGLALTINCTGRGGQIPVRSAVGPLMNAFTTGRRKHLKLVDKQPIYAYSFRH